ncbi:hypothetical protein DCS_03067 [Drechmeria coniospora]|uniref:Uncharacterized protein n=1 Tax=Drechmeria coniospora TaxID=98403 RepID=A0A151GY03_DRECN|nr:hypothetical protein DCS_03067 [Drechmeria coniospora]KYK61922.1 hypothetical protein DCS_03067 [Drechmeria coniospora]
MRSNILALAAAPLILLAQANGRDMGPTNKAPANVDPSFNGNTIDVDPSVAQNGPGGVPPPTAVDEVDAIDGNQINSVPAPGGPGVAPPAGGPGDDTNGQHIQHAGPPGGPVPVPPPAGGQVDATHGQQNPPAACKASCGAIAETIQGCMNSIQANSRQGAPSQVDESQLEDLTHKAMQCICSNPAADLTKSFTPCVECLRTNTPGAEAESIDQVIQTFQAQCQAHSGSTQAPRPGESQVVPPPPASTNTPYPGESPAEKYPADSYPPETGVHGVNSTLRGNSTGVTVSQAVGRLPAADALLYAVGLIATAFFML